MLLYFYSIATAPAKKKTVKKKKAKKPVDDKDFTLDSGDIFG